MWYFCIFLYFHKSTFFIKYHFLHYYEKGWFSKYMGFSSKTDGFGFLGFYIWDTYIGLLGISMWINLWCGLDGFVQMGSDGSDGSDSLFRWHSYGWGWSSWVGRYILLINPVDKTLVWWVVFQEVSRWFPGRVMLISCMSSCGSGG